MDERRSDVGKAFAGAAGTAGVTGLITNYLIMYKGRQWFGDGVDDPATMTVIMTAALAVALNVQKFILVFGWWAFDTYAPVSLKEAFGRNKVAQRADLAGGNGT